MAERPEATPPWRPRTFWEGFWTGLAFPVPWIVWALRRR
jgi:hypothetical protein